MPTLIEMQKGARDRVRQMTEIAEKATAEKRDLSADERAQVKALRSEYDELKGKIDDQQGSDELRKMIADLSGVGVPDAGDGAPGDDRKNGRKGVADEFLGSALWREWFKGQAGAGGSIPETRKGLNSPPVPVHLNLGRKLFTGSDDESAGAFVVPEQSGIFEPLGRYPMSLRDLISVRTTGSDTVEFVRQVSQSTAAAFVAESNVATPTGATGEVTGLKPYSSWEYERVSAGVKTLAVWTAATKRALADAGQIRGLIEQELREDLAEELEYQILHGDGSGENLLGISNTPDVLVQPFDTDIAATARKAITRLQTQGKQNPTAFLMNPADWEAYDLLQDNSDRYYWGGPMAQGRRTLWGIPVVESYYLSPGTAYLANWSKAVLWDRQAATLSVTDSHSDFFIRNLVALLAELRVAFGVIRPSAFVEVHLSNES